MSDGFGEGGGDLSRLIILRDNSRSAAGVEQDKELGNKKAFIFGFVESVDDNNLITEEAQGFPQPRNWHTIEGPGNYEGSEIKQRRVDVSLILDHQTDFAGWQLDARDTSPFLDDWFEDGGEVQQSTRLVDRKDPRGRTALLSQTLIIKDDHLQQYTSALNLGPEVGDHFKAAAGYVYDNDNDFMGRMSDFWTTNNLDKIGNGRENTPYGLVGMRHDAHVEFPGVAHGRFHIAREFCDDYDEMPAKNAGGGGSAPSDSGGSGDPAVHFFKARLMYDHKVQGQDTELNTEDAQLRPVYHCIDGPEKKTTVNNVIINDFEEITNITNITNNFSSVIVIVVINNGGGGGAGGGRQIVEIVDPNNPGDPPVITETPIPPGAGKPRTPPPGGGNGRIVCLPLSHNPPLLDGLEHETHGYIAVSDDGNGGQNGWIGGWGKPAVTPFGPAPGSDVGSSEVTPFGPAPGAGVGVGASALSPNWKQVVTVPPDAPAGKTFVTDGKGGVKLGDPPPLPVVENPPPASTGLTPPADTPNGYLPVTNDQADDGSGVTWEPAEEIVPPAPPAASPKGYITGFELSYDPALPSIVHVTPGLCRDSTNTSDIPVGDPDVDYLTNGGPLFNDALLNTDLGSLSATVSNAGAETGVSLAALTTAFPFTSLPSYTLTGAVDIASAAGAPNVAMTEHSAGTCRFTTELAVGDLVGDPAIGYFAVLAITDDGHATVCNDTGGLGDGGSSAAITSASALNVYQNAQVQVGAGPSKRVMSVTPGRKILATRGKLNGGANAGGLGVVWGQPAPYLNTGVTFGTVYLMPSWVFLWARRTSGGTSTLSWSTQRTTPLTPATLTGYSIWRLLSALPIGTDNFTPPFSYQPDGLVMYEGPSFWGGVGGPSYPTVPLNSVVGTGAWTALSLISQVPPTSTRCLLMLSVAPTGGVGILNVRTRGVADPAGASSSPRQVLAVSGTQNSASFPTDTDSLQDVEWLGNGGVGGAHTIVVVGYYDGLRAAGGGGGPGPTGPVGPTGPAGVAGDPTCNRQTLSADIALTSGSARKQYLDPNGANRKVSLPAAPATALYFLIKNIAAIGTAKKLIVRDNANVLVAVLTPGASATVTWDGTAWESPFDAIPNAFLWLKSDFGLYTDTSFVTPVVADGDPVAGWKNFRGDCPDFTQFAGGNQGVYKLAIVNGKPIVRMSGAVRYLDTSNGGAGQKQRIGSDITVFVVASRPWASGAAGTSPFLTSRPAFNSVSGLCCYLSISGASHYGMEGYTATTDNVPFALGDISGLADNTFHVLSAFVGTDSNAFKDGALASADFMNGSATRPLSSGQILEVGADPSANACDGDIAELIVFNRRLTASEHAYVEQLLGDKYAITIN